MKRGVPSRWAWAPVLAAVALTALVAMGSNQVRHEPRYLLPILNAIFLTGAASLVAILAARTFLAGGTVALLPMGGGMLAVGLSSLLSSLVLQSGRVDAGVTIFNIAMCMAGAGQLLGAAWLLLWRAGAPVGARRPRGLRGLRGLRGMMLLAAYGVAALAVLAIFVWVDDIPTFVDPHTGPTPIRKVVIGAAMAQFAAASLLMLVAGWRSRSAFFRWYGLGLLLIATGLCGVGLATVIGSAITWTGRAVQHVGGIYLLVATAMALRESRGWGIPIRLLQETHQRYTSLVDLCPDAILVHAEGRYVFANPAAAKLFGAASPAELIGRSILELVQPEFRAMVQQRIREAEQTGQPTPLEELRMSRLDGQVVDVEVCRVRVEYEGRPAYQVVLRDITQRKRAEQEIQRAKEAAEAASRAKDQFIAKLSHELRTPLTPVVASLSALARDQRIPDDLRDDLELVERNIALEVHLINDLLDVTRIVNGKLEMHREPVDLAGVLRDTGGIVQGDLDARNQVLTIETPGAPYWLDGDRARLHQVFWNLLKNATKFSPSGARIAVEATCADGIARVVVRDAGEGIEPAELSRLFRAFEQGAAGASFGGLGLGLTICKGIVELHGGTIAAASAGRGKGATFTVELPMAAPPSVACDPAAQPASASRALRILLVEDHEDTARVMGRLLRAADHEVTWVPSVQDALAAARSGGFDVLISDMGLPDGTGCDLMRQLVSEGRGLRGIAVTGYGTAEDVRRALEAGFVEHVTKPISIDALHDALIRVANGPLKYEGVGQG